MVNSAEKKENKNDLREALDRYKRQSDFWGRYFGERQELRGNLPSIAVVEAVPVFKERGVKKIIDIGCGIGKDSFFLEKQGFTVFALDASPEAIKFVKDRIERQGIKNVHPIVGDATAIDYPDGTFDAAVNHRVIDLWKTHEIKNIVDEMERIVKEGGLVLVSMASVNSEIYKGKLNGAGKDIEPGTIYYKGLTFHFFSEEEVRNLFKNFNIISLEERLSTDNKNMFWVLLAEKKK
jgi:ubiquinone/menaquinone biosynthesis C-methylase UbiE